MSSSRWKLLEGVVAAIEASLADVPDTRVTRNVRVPERVTGQLRQVDVLVEIPASHRRLRIAIEVRDRSRPLDITGAEQLCAKLRKLDVDRRCIVARSGFTAPAREAAASEGVECRLIAEIETPRWWAVDAMDLYLRQVELLHATVNFADKATAEAVSAALADAPRREAQIVEPEKAPYSLFTFVAGQGAAALGRPECAAFADQDVFRLQVFLRGWREGSHVVVGDTRFPLPDNVVASYRVHEAREAVALLTYKGGVDLTVFSGTSERTGKQFTFLCRSLPDGLRSISVSVEPADKLPTDVSRISHDDNYR